VAGSLALLRETLHHHPCRIFQGKIFAWTRDQLVGNNWRTS